MKRWTLLALAALMFGVGGQVLGQDIGTAEVVSKGQTVDLAAKRVPEKATVYVFYRPASTLERAFVDELQKQANEKVSLRLVQLQTGAEPITKQYEVTTTPFALVYDRRGRLTGRDTEPDKIQVAIQQAAGVMRIDWPEKGDPRLDEVQRLIGRVPTGGILRTMTAQPEFLKYIHELSQKAHFTDGFLDRRTKEMIATYVSALNRCKY